MVTIKKWLAVASLFCSLLVMSVLTIGLSNISLALLVILGENNPLVLIVDALVTLLFLFLNPQQLLIPAL